MSDRLEAPKTLHDIVQFGLDNPDASTNAFAEILHQLYKSDKYQSLICVDGINQWYQPSFYPSFRYANYRKLKSHIPPQDLALCRLLMKFDGHYMRNGVKVMATSHYRMFNHIAEPEHIGHYPGYNARVENLKLNDFRNAMAYYQVTDLYPTPYAKEWKLEADYMECQGNLGEYHINQWRNEPTYS